MSYVTRLTVLRTLVLILATSLVLAEVPGMINYQGRLTDENGDPLTGVLTVSFAICSTSTTASVIWSETQDVELDENGLFGVLLGTTTPLDPSVFDEPNRWLSVSVGGEEILPRTEFTSVPYAFSGGGFIDEGNIVYAQDTMDIVKIGTKTSSTADKKFYVRSYDQNTAIAATNTNSSYGVGVAGVVQGSEAGTFAGILGKALTPSGAPNYGAYGEAADGDINYGVYGKAHGAGGANYGIYGYAYDGTTNYAGYFDGNVHITGNLTGPTNFSDNDWTINGDEIYHETGNVGIGISSPANLLHVEGPGTILGGYDANSVVTRFRQSNTGLHSAISIDALTGQDAELFLAEDGSADWVVKTDFSDSKKFKIASLEPSYESRMTINQDGKVGIGETNPEGNLHIKDLSASLIIDADNEGSGEEAKVVFRDADATADQLFEIAFDPQSNDLHIRSDDNSWSNIITIEHEGEVGIGTNDPTSKLQVNGAIRLGGGANQYEILEELHNDGDPWDGFLGSSGISIGNDAGVNRQKMIFTDGGGNDNVFTITTSYDDGVNWYPRFIVEQNGEVGIGTTNPSTDLHVIGNICYTGSIGTCSDLRYKKNVNPIKNALSLVAEMRPVTFNWRSEEYPDYEFGEEKQIGLIAQEIKDVLPQVVIEDETGYYNVDYSRLTPVLIQAIKEQQEMIELLTEQNKELIKRIENIESR